MTRNATSSRHVLEGASARSECRLANMADLAHFLAAPDFSERLLELLGGWIWETDRNHRFTYLGGAAVTHAGLPVEACLGRTHQEVGIQGAGGHNGSDWLGQLDRQEMVGPANFVWRQVAGEIRFQSIGAPRFDRSGSFAGHFGIAFLVGAGDGVQLEDRRKEVRRRSVRAGEIVVSGRSPVMCMTANVSDSGACVRVLDQTSLPDRFALRMFDKNVTLPVELRWRNGERAGVRFLS